MTWILKYAFDLTKKRPSPPVEKSWGGVQSCTYVHTCVCMRVHTISCEKKKGFMLLNPVEVTAQKKGSTFQIFFKQ